MKWFKRSLWLAAWAVWLWLGFGLDRELPQNLGPKVCSIPVQRPDFVNGFVDGKPIALAIELRQSDGQWGWRTFDAETGSLQREICTTPANWDRAFIASRNRFLCWSQLPKDLRDIVSVPANFDPPSMLPRGGDHRYIIDCLTGRVLEATGDVQGPVVHQTRPWGAFTCPDGVVVLDLQSGKRLFELKHTAADRQRELLVDSPRFVGDDRIALTYLKRSRRVDIDSGTELRIWTIPAGEEPVGTFRGPAQRSILRGRWNSREKGSMNSADVKSSRLASPRSGDGTAGVDVFDLEAGEHLLIVDDPADKTVFSRGLTFLPPVLSSDGRRAFIPLSGRVYDVRERRPLWQIARNELLCNVADDGRFEVEETWKIGAGAFTTEWRTYAVRSQSDGDRISRSWQPVLKSQCTTSDGRRLALVGTDVHALPLQVSWALLTLCQSILALPLVLIWAALKLRSQRAARRQPAGANA